ncbi:hypothetical protein ABK046_51265, partial [Streptomyces caeruleatus]
TTAETYLEVSKASDDYQNIIDGNGVHSNHDTAEAKKNVQQTKKSMNEAKNIGNVFGAKCALFPNTLTP